MIIINNSNNNNNNTFEHFISIDHAGKDSFKFVTIPDLVRQYR